jgi:hypothetical protein
VCSFYADNFRFDSGISVQNQPYLSKIPQPPSHLLPALIGRNSAQHFSILRDILGKTVLGHGTVISDAGLFQQSAHDIEVSERRKSIQAISDAILRVPIFISITLFICIWLVESLNSDSFKRFSSRVLRFVLNMNNWKQETADSFAGLSELKASIPVPNLESLRKLEQSIQQESKERSDDAAAVVAALRKLQSDIDAFAAQIEPRLIKLEQDEHQRALTESEGSHFSIAAKFRKSLSND